LKRLFLTLVFSSFLLSSIFSFTPAHSLDLSEIIKIAASDALPFDNFGGGVSISGDTAIVGAHLHDDEGAAYIYEKNGGTWTQVAKLTASDATSGDRFGDGVSISGDTAIVGAPAGEDGVGDSGVAYIFEKPGGGWVDATEDAKLSASDAAFNDLFGFVVSISGDTAIVGAIQDDSEAGSAYIFVKPGGGWVDATEDAKLTASDAQQNDFFGWSVSISGDTALVSASGNGIFSGAAYIFEKPGGGWVDATEDAMLTASDVANDDFFGISVSISGASALVGSFNDDDAGSNAGAVYVFMKPGGGWVDATEDSKLTASDTTVNDAFGFAVSLSGDTAIFGAPGANAPSADDSGAAYIFGPEILVGGELIPLDTTSLLLTGAQMNAAWMIPVIVSAIGIGIVIARKF